MTTELKPCPFCGKQPNIVCPDNSYGSALVTCGDANECPVDLTAWAELNSGETLDDAIAAWNTRPQPIVTTEGLVGHTPGPWLAAAKYSSVVGLPVVQQGRGRSIASVTFFNIGEGFENHERESYANARLIAKAPELLAQVQSLTDRIASLERALTELLVAVEFAAPPKNMGGTEDDPNMCFEARVPVEFVEIARAALSTTHPLNADEEA